jgi:hypothetical protein
MGKIDERLTTIGNVSTQLELDRTMDEYREQILADHPELKATYALNAALQLRQYFYALTLVPRGGRWNRKYLHVIRLIERAADKQFLMAKGRGVKD